MSALDFPNDAGLRGAVPSRSVRTASPQFQKVWDALDAKRAARGLSPETVAQKCGFERTAWFSYRKKGTIPFNLLERLAEYLEDSVEIQLAKSVVSDPRGKWNDVQAAGVKMPDYLKRIADELAKLPEGDRPVAAGLALAAIKEEVKSHPFDEPSADPKASRGRGSK